MLYLKFVLPAAACSSSDLIAICNAINASQVFGDHVREQRREAELRRDEMYEIAAADMDSWAKDPTAMPWIMSEVLQRYPSSLYREETDDRVACARTALQEKLAKTIDSLDSEMRSLTSSNDITDIDIVLTKHKKDRDLVPEAYRALQTRRQQLSSSLHSRVNSALTSADIWEIAKVALEASSAGLREETVALQNKKTSIIEEATRELQELLNTDNYAKIADTLIKYEDYPDDIGSALVQLQEHARSMQEEARTYLREQSQHASDPLQLSEIITKYEEFGEPVADMLHAVKIRRLNLIEAARRELQSMCYRQNLTVEEAEEAITKYEAFGGDFETELQALRANVANIVDTIADEAMRSKYSNNLETVTVAITENEQLLARYQPETLTNLREYQSEMLDQMHKQVEEAIAGSDPRIMTQLMAKMEQQGFVSHAQNDVDQLRQRAESSVAAICEQLRRLAQSDDIVAVETAIDKYHERGYPVAVEQATDALKAHSEHLTRQARRRINDAVETIADPQQLSNVISEHKEYEDSLSDELARAKAHRLTLIQDAKTRMQLLIQSPDATIEELSKVYQEFSEYSFEVRSERTNLHYRIERAINDAERHLQDATLSTDVTRIDQILANHAASKDLLEPAYGELIAHKQNLIQRMRETILGSLASIRDPWKVKELLEAAAPYGSNVATEVDQLNELYEHLV